MGIAMTQYKSAINLLPDSPGLAVNAEITNAIINIAMAARAMAAASCLRFFIIISSFQKTDYKQQFSQIWSD